MGGISTLLVQFRRKLRGAFMAFTTTKWFAHSRARVMPEALSLLWRAANEVELSLPGNTLTCATRQHVEDVGF
jgi:hypothetical protein